jgi:hypothetical protein
MNRLLIATIDHDGTGGANGADAPVFLADLIAYAGGLGSFRGRSDFDRNRAVEGADGSLRLAIQIAGGGGLGTGSAKSCTSPVNIP